MREFPCPCCGYLVFNEPPGSYAICPICFWEDDAVQLTNPWYEGGANTLSLVMSQYNFQLHGAMDPRFLDTVRGPTAEDRKDPRWRLVEERDGAFITTPREIEQARHERGQDIPYEYWLRTTAWNN